MAVLNTNQQIVVALTGKDWEPTDKSKYYAQIETINQPSIRSNPKDNASQPFAFGSTPEEAVTKLLAKLV
jgi:hypothetical protein